MTLHKHSLVLTLSVALFLSHTIIESKPDKKKAHQDNKKTETQADKTPASDSTTSKDTGLNQIDQIWMKEIKDTKKTQPQVDAEEKDLASEDKEGTPTTTRLPNPGNQENVTDGLFAKSEAPSFFSVLLRFTGLMALFIGGFYLLIQYMKKKGKGTFLNHNNGLIQVVLSVPLVQGKFLQIVDIAGKMMILGVSETGIQMLSPIEDGNTLDKIRLWQSKNHGVASPVGLLDSLGDMFKKSDFKFWKEPAPKKERFEDVLNAEIPSRSTRNNQIKASALGQNKSYSPADEFTSADQEIEDIESMLKKHERKLKSLKKKK